MNMKVKVTDTNMYCNKAFADTTVVENIFSGSEMEEEYMYEEEVTMPDYEEEDAFSDVEYDSDDCEVSIRKRANDDDDEEEEIWEEDEEDEEVSNAIRLQLLREANKQQLEGLSVLDGKLHWLEKVPVVESDVDNDEYPILGVAVAKPAAREKSDTKAHRSPNVSPKIQYKTAKYIDVFVGQETFIELESVYCKDVKDGKLCTYGDRCKFSHDMPKPKPEIDYSTRLCNAIRTGEKCKFGNHCKFSHDLALIKPEIDYSTRLCNAIRTGEKCKFGNHCKFSHDLALIKRYHPEEPKKSKPECRNGLKCENRKCTFIHPVGHKKKTVTVSPQTTGYQGPVTEGPRQRVYHKSPQTTGYQGPVTEGPRQRVYHKSPQTTGYQGPVTEGPRQRVYHKSPSQIAKTQVIDDRIPCSPPQPLPDKKFRLCLNMFKVDAGGINIIGECRFGTNCMYAHSRTDVEKKIKDNFIDFECKSCNNVQIEFLTKKDKDGKDRKTRRYMNIGNYICRGIHEKERVTDFIIRTQSPRITNV
jgi:hypothetical protein